MHHGALEGQISACPVNALAILVAHIRVHTSNGTTVFCAYWDIVVRVDVTDRDMSFHMKFAAAKLGYPSRNILLYRIDTHSNRVGGACEMKLAKFDAFLEYIQQQLSGVSQGMETKMSKIAICTNMEGSAIMLTPRSESA